MHDNFWMKMPGNFDFFTGEWMYECIYECMKIHETFDFYPFEYMSELNAWLYANARNFDLHDA